MIRQNFSPAPPLARFIECYRFFAFKIQPGTSFEMIDYPNAYMDMVFCLDGEIEITNAEGTSYSVRQHAFYGHFSAYYKVTFKGDCKMLNVRFKPNGVYPFTSTPLGEFRDKGANLYHLIGHLADRLYQKIGNEQSLPAMIDQLDHFLLNQVYHNYNLDGMLETALDLAVQSKGESSVKILCDQLNIGYRKIDRLFKTQVGLPPKQFLKLIRFRHILNDVLFQQTPDWMQIVADYNFHDQSHLIKEFKKITGESPSAFIQRQQSLERRVASFLR